MQQRNTEKLGFKQFTELACSYMYCLLLYTLMFMWLNRWIIMSVLVSFFQFFCG